MTRVLPTGLVLLLGIGCASEPAPLPEPWTETVSGRDPQADDHPPVARFEALLARPELQPLRQPERVETLPVRSFLPKSDRYEIGVNALPVPQHIAADIRTLLLDRTSYLGGVLACVFEPGLSIRFTSAGQSVDVVVCFKCGEVAFVAKGDPFPGKSPLTDEAAQRLLALARLGRPKYAPLWAKGLRGAQ